MNEPTIAEAIAWFEKRKAGVTMPGANAMYDKAIKALRAQAEAEKNGTLKIPFERLKELEEADARGMVLVASIPIGTVVYRLNKGESEEVRMIEGEAYTRRVPNWYVTHHEYSWIDAMVDAEHPERMSEPHCRYYLTKEEAFAERDRINVGGDPYRRKQEEGIK